MSYSFHDKARILWDLYTALNLFAGISLHLVSLECVCQELRFLLLLLLLNCHDSLYSSEFWQGQEQTSWHVEKKDIEV